MNVTELMRNHGIGTGKRLEGDAAPGDLRGGKTAMNRDGKITGTVPVRLGGDVVPGPGDQVKAAGIYDTPITVKGVVVPAAKVLNDTAIAGTQGTMPYRGAVIVTPGPADQGISVGYHTGGGVVKGVPVDASKLLAGTTIAGTAGAMPDRGAVIITPGQAAQAIPAGYHSGAGNVPAVAFDAGKVLNDTVIAGKQGAMPNQGAPSFAPRSWQQGIPAGYQNGGGVVQAIAGIDASKILQGHQIADIIGTLAPGVPKASGQAGTSYDTLAFTRWGDNAVLQNYYIEIGGLGFLPKVIVMQLTSEPRRNVVYNVDDHGDLSTAAMATGHPAFYVSGNSYVQNGGFRLPVSDSSGGGVQYKWRAIG